MLILASKSPRRSELLQQAGYPFRVVVSEAGELTGGLEPSELVQKNACLKALKVAGEVGDAVPVLGADTVVVADTCIFGKPADRREAKRMLMVLSGREHLVMTGVALVHNGRVYKDTAVTKVFFAPLSEELVERYLDSGEPEGKAGAYAVQGRAAVFIRRLEGSFSNVVGLPLFLVRELAEKAGVDLYGNDGA